MHRVIEPSSHEAAGTRKLNHLPKSDLIHTQGQPVVFPPLLSADILADPSPHPIWQSQEQSTIHLGNHDMTTSIQLEL
jgi:hypothetical protein